ncbi:MAG: phenylalanine--tRNA ligase subunit alpha [Spirochaetia bacterium]|nr:phenylalanine--tRNA ligase subunit alpha [Spirochaetia bacterium]
MPLIDDISDLEGSALASLYAGDLAALDGWHAQFLGKKGSLTEILKGLKDLAPEERKEAGSRAHQAREKLESSYLERKRALSRAQMDARLASEQWDALRPYQPTRGHQHPITQITEELEDLFTVMGFTVMDGPEVETDANNFGKLNFSDDHPARDMQDTIWLKGEKALMRTHTSSVQVRSMQLLKPPFRIVAPGRCFRFEETDASHENTFYQAEGMMIDKNLSVANLIHVMKTFLSSFFERDVNVRLRPGFFPFVEPGFELDIQCLVCGGPGCPVCKHSGWVELLPCGMVHPNVLRAGGLDPNEWNGFAFGLGLSRLVMMRYAIEDIRHFLSGNLRFLEQF